MDDNFAYDAVIEVLLDNDVHKATLGTVGMGYGLADEEISEANFRQRVFAVARSLEKAYEFWPGGMVSVNTKFIKECVNG
jgi:hypothetical protein